MTQPYLVAMQHLEWRARDVLRKHARNRPLGQLEKQHRYTPPQPVLSCRTVDIDTSGTRTYRCRSNTDIIEEQHRLIHDIYTKARNISAPSTPTRPKHTGETGGRPLRLLQVEGHNSRPYTSPGGVRPPSSSKPALSDEATVLKRPHTTTATHRKARAATDTHLDLSPSHEIRESSATLRDSHSAIREQWKTENHTLDEGKFVRGKKPEGGSSIDQHSRYQWLGFGGGQRERSGGVVDAFTGVKEPEFYSIDGTTGTRVARQLRKGDKIQIGINGAMPPPGWKNRHYAVDNRMQYPEQPVPLCWDDELSHPDAKVISPRAPREDPPRPNLCETNPVYVERPAKEANPYIRAKYGDAGKSKYMVSMETRTRKGLNGKMAPAPITNISIAARNTTPDPDMLDVSVDEILESKLHNQNPRLEDSQVTLIANVKGEWENTVPPKEEEAVGKQDKEQDEMKGEPCSPDGDSPTAQMGVNSRPSTVALSHTGMSSAGSPRGELDHLMVACVSAHSPIPEKTKTPERTTRTASAGRPPPLKPSRTRTPGQVAQSSNKDAEYIQISQQMLVKPTAGGEAGDMATSEMTGVPTSAIQSVSQYNKPKNVPGPAGDQPTVTHMSPEPLPPAAPTTPVLDEGQETQQETINYAFNIPTADMLSEANSVADLGETSHSHARDATETGSRVSEKS